ncbi:MAG: LysM peptidoglycan-binding domain-containing protein [Microbacteriaceae bacterium]
MAGSKTGQIMNEPWKPQVRPDAQNVLAGLVPTRDYAAESLASMKETGVFSGSMLSTMPILLAGSMAVSMTFTGAVAPVNAKPVAEPRSSNDNAFGNVTSSRSENASTRHTEHTLSLSTTGTSEPVPALYTVVTGDTVSDIAARYGLSTASVLALNGLGWKSTIFPGQNLRLTSAVAAAPRVAVEENVSMSITRYTVVRGDTITRIAAKFATSVSSLLAANNLSSRSLIFPGQTLVVPVSVSGNPSPISATDALGAAGQNLAPVVPGSNNGDIQPDPQPQSDGRSEATVEISTPQAEPPVAQVPVTVEQVESAPTTQQPAVAPPTSGSYLIKSGDTLSKIATSLGTTLSALCAANGLSPSSVIYAGKTLLVPSGSAPAAIGGNVTLLTAEGEANARTIISVGRELGVSDYGIVIALATAMQESTMRNLNYGHLDSVGLFQQRPASGWGTPAQLTTPAYAARLFYGGASNPNKGKTRGLLDISGWQSMTLTQAAQRVQISAYPDAYAKWETSARYWLSTL